MSDLQDAGVLVRMAYRGMRNAGIDSRAVLEMCGLNPDRIADQELRTPHEAQALFWQAALEVSGDSDVGLHLGEQVPVFKGQVLEYLFLSSATFGDGLERALAYQRLLSDAAQSRLDGDEQGAYLALNTVAHPAPVLRHFTECVTVGMLAFFRFVTEGAFAPRQVIFSHPRPEHRRVPGGEHERVLGCPVRFGGSENRLYFDPQLLSHPSAHAEPELLQVHERVASEQIAKLEKRDIVIRVRRAIGELLDSGGVSLEAVAERLELKPRHLRAQLEEAGTNFNQVLSELRCRLAKRLLARTQESIDEIVYLTGFSEPSTFYRAFKRWVGVTPVEYRREKQGAAGDTAPG